MEKNDAIKAENRYHWGCCFVCKKVTTADQPLKRCSRCHCIFYCSKDHQVQDWKRHKSLCFHLSSAAEEVASKNFFGPELQAEELDFFKAQNEDGNVDEQCGDEDLEMDEFRASEIPEDKAQCWKSWSKFRRNAVIMCEIMLNRKLKACERELFLFPKACRVCRLCKNENMLDCYTCCSVTYCCEEHREQNKAQHELMCHELKYAMFCDNYESTVSIAIPLLPSEVDKEMTELGETILKHLSRFVFVPDMRKGPNNEVDLDEMNFRFLTWSLTSPLTLLHSYLASGKSTKSDQLVFHIVGCDVVEMIGIIKWEYVLHRLPDVKSIRYVFIGLDLEHEEDGDCSSQIQSYQCEDCLNSGRKIYTEFRKKTYKEYAMSSNFLEPNLVCAFNCGFHEFIGTESDTWSESLPFLTKTSEVPLVFTSYSKAEAHQDLDAIVKSRNNLKIHFSCIENPFRSYRPIRDFAFDDDKDVFYQNNFFSVVWQEM